MFDTTRVQRDFDTHVRQHIERAFQDGRLDQGETDAILRSVDELMRRQTCGNPYTSEDKSMCLESRAEYLRAMRNLIDRAVGPANMERFVTQEMVYRRQNPEPGPFTGGDLSRGGFQLRRAL
jgi:hypothetical protein